MKFKQNLGVVMLLTPFLAILTLSVMLLGFIQTLGIVVTVLAVVFLISGGLYLMEGDKE